MRGNDPQDRLCDCITSLFSLPFSDNDLSRLFDDASPVSAIPATSAGLGLTHFEYPGRHHPHETHGSHEHRVQLIMLGIPSHLTYLSSREHFINWDWRTVEQYFEYLQNLHEEHLSHIDVPPPVVPPSPIRRNVVTVVPPHLERFARNFRLRYPTESMDDFVQQLERRAALYDDDYDPAPRPCTPQFQKFIVGAVCYSLFVLIACLRVLNMLPFF